MAIPYRTRRALKTVGAVLLILAVAAVFALLCLTIWLGRFQVFSRDGSVRLDFDRSSQLLSGEPALPPEQKETVSIYYNEGEDLITTSKELTPIIGYHITAADLRKDCAGVLEQVKKLPGGTAVMVDVKNPSGEFFYSSTVAEFRNSSIDPAAMDQLIAYLKKANLYTIARLPAMSDYHYGLRHVPDGLHHSSGLYLWTDDNNNYWLNPASSGTVAYWIQIVTELRELGFDEVLFYDFAFPKTDKIMFGGDKAETLAKTAQTLVTTCAKETFAVSFVGDGFTAPEGRSRRYLENVAAADAAAVAAASGYEDPSVYLVFLTEVHDTRFDNFSVLRPMAAIY